MAQPLTPSAEGSGPTGSESTVAPAPDAGQVSGLSTDTQLSHSTRSGQRNRMADMPIIYIKQNSRLKTGSAGS